jgi:nucleoid-associated protein YgaU
LQGAPTSTHFSAQILFTGFVPAIGRTLFPHVQQQPCEQQHTPDEKRYDQSSRPYINGLLIQRFTAEQQSLSHAQQQKQRK